MPTQSPEEPGPQDSCIEPVRASRAMPRDEGQPAPPFAPLALKGDDTPAPTPRRAVRVMIRYQDREAHVVRERARVCGLPIARFIREVSLGAVPKERRHRALDELIRQLARIGNNLNQLAHQANAHDRFPMEEQIDAALDALRDVIHQLADDDRGPAR